MRKVFYSFHYQNDNWRVSQVRNIGVVDKSKIATPNEWEDIKQQGERAIKKWIDDNLIGCSCLVVLIGSKTAERKYVLYEIEQAWNRGMGVLGIYIDGLKNKEGLTSSFGENPFRKFKFEEKRVDYVNEIFKPLLPMVLDIPIHNPTAFDSKITYNNIQNNLADWIENSISYRKGKPNICRDELTIHLFRGW